MRAINAISHHGTAPSRSTETCIIHATVPAKVFANFRKVRSMTRELAVIARALEGSKVTCFGCEGINPSLLPSVLISSLSFRSGAGHER